MARALDKVDLMMSALVCIWGSAFVAIKAIGESADRAGLDPFQITWFRYAPFLVVYGAYLVLKRRDVFARVLPLDWARLAILGLFGVVGYHFSLNVGLHGPHAVSGATGSVLVAAGPLFILAVAILAGQEKLRVGAVWGSLLSFAGVAIVVLYGSGSKDLDLAKNALLVLMAPISWSIYTVVAKPLVARYGGLFVTGMSMGLGTLALVPLGIHYGVAPLRQLSAGQLGWLAFLAFAATIAGYAIWNQALKHRSASDVAVFIYFQPLVTTILGWIVLGEHASLLFLLGAALTLAGVVVVNRVRLQAARAAAAASVAETKP